MINAISYLLILTGWASMAYFALKSLRTGRLQPFSAMLETRGKAPILRATTPARLWALWLTVICLIWLAFVVTVLFFLFAGPV
jgi:hypothetical protein